MTHRTDTWLQSFFLNAQTWLDKEQLPVRALDQRAACHLRRARLFQMATRPLLRLQVPIRRNTRALLAPSIQPAPYFSLGSLCYDSRRTSDCCFQERRGKKMTPPSPMGELLVHHRALPRARDKQWPESVLTCTRGGQLKGRAGVGMLLEGFSPPIRGNGLMA